MGVVIGGGSSDLNRLVLFKDHSVPSLESGLQGVGMDWRPGEWFLGGVETQQKPRRELGRT